QRIPSAGKAVQLHTPAFSDNHRALKVQHSQPHITPLSRNNSLEHCPRCIIRWIAPVTRDRTENSIRTCGRGNLGQHLPAIQEKTIVPLSTRWTCSSIRWTKPAVLGAVSQIF